jgi:DNA-binding LacI/PurR family transcriptional regulator
VSEKAKAANIFDVARLAGVSHQTVSRVLNGMPNVRPATRERVERAITQLRYVPSPAARALVTKRSRVIGLITTSASEYGPASTALHVNEAARRERYNVLATSMVEASSTAVRDAVESLVRQSAEGIVVIADRRDVLDSVYALEAGIPVISIDSSSKRPDTVSIDQREGARIAVAHLAELGHREIAHLAGPADSPDAGERLRGWRDELMSQGLVARSPLEGDWSPASGFAAGQRLATGSPFTAVFAANDDMALGFMHAMHVRGLRVPDDISVIGFDDVPAAAYFTPPLTTMRQDFSALGETIMRLLVDAIDGRSTPLDVWDRPTLVVRESTAAPTTPGIGATTQSSTTTSAEATTQTSAEPSADTTSPTGTEPKR